MVDLFANRTFMQTTFSFPFPKFKRFLLPQLCFKSYMQLLLLVSYISLICNTEARTYAWSLPILHFTQDYSIALVRIFSRCFLLIFNIKTQNETEHKLIPLTHEIKVNSESASHGNWCTATLWNRIMTAQCKGMGEVGSARYEPVLLPPCPSIRVLSHSNYQRSTHASRRAWQCKCFKRLICYL